MAATLDRFRNNTSLVLAIERIADGRVLLFPADAQEGNMLSWHDPQIRWWVNGLNGRVRKVDAADLLKRTGFSAITAATTPRPRAKGGDHAAESGADGVYPGRSGAGETAEGELEDARRGTLS